MCCQSYHAVDVEKDFDLFLQTFADTTCPFEKHFVGLKSFVRRFFYDAQTPATEGRVLYVEKRGDALEAIPDSKIADLVRRFVLCVCVSLLIIFSLTPLLNNTRKEMRASAARALRFLCGTPARVKIVLRYFEWSIVCLLELPDSLHKKERSQALQVSVNL